MEANVEQGGPSSAASASSAAPTGRTLTESAEPAPTQAPQHLSSKLRIAIGVAIAALAVACIVIGVAGNEQTAVLRKATRICLECIGIA